MVAETAVGLVKLARAPSTRVDLGALAESFAGGRCDVVMIAVPCGMGKAILETVMVEATGMNIDVEDQRRG